MSTAKPSALEALKSLGKKTVPATSPLAAQVNDPAIAGARRDKNTVKLGFDPAMAPQAAHCAALKEALERAEAEFKVDQASMRDYGISKRSAYNDTFKADVTTVCVPYEVDTPAGKETRYVQVICSHKYSVQTDMVLGNKDRLGESYDRLFVEETTKSLKPNAEQIVRGILEEVGLKGDELETAMANLFDVKTVVKASESYEKEHKKLPEDLRSLLDQAVTRSAPGLKFP